MTDEPAKKKRKYHRVAPKLTASELKRRKKNRDKIPRSKIYIGQGNLDRWQRVKQELGLTTNPKFITFLLNHYEATKTSCAVIGSPFPRTAAAVGVAVRYHASKPSKSKFYAPEEDTVTETDTKAENLYVKCEPLSPDGGFESQDVDVKHESPQAVDVKLEPCDPTSLVKLEERVVQHSNGQLTEDEKIPLTIPRDDNSEQESHPESMQMCLSCGAGLPQFDLLAEMNHKGKKLHVCEQCGSAFAIYSNLVHHMMMRSHVGCRPIRCQTCGQCFQKASPSEAKKQHGSVYL